MRKDSLVEDYFEVIDNEHKAYWLGFLMADGCILDMPLSNGTKNSSHCSNNGIAVRY